MKQAMGIAWLAVMATAATGQDTADGASNLRQQYEVLTGQEHAWVQACHTLHQAAGLVDDRERRLMLGDAGFLADGGQPAPFWADYLRWLGIEADPARSTGLAETVRTRAPQGPDDGVFARTRQLEQGCREAQASLQASRCPDADADKAMHVPIRMLQPTKLCRELAAQSSRRKPAQWVRDDPAQRARFEQARQADLERVQRYDALLAGQAVPQCPVGVIGADVLPLFGGGGSAAFQPEADLLHTEFGRWDVARRVAAGQYSPENDLKLSQMPYIRWQVECDKFDALFGVPTRTR